MLDSFAPLVMPTTVEPPSSTFDLTPMARDTGFLPRFAEWQERLPTKLPIICGRKERTSAVYTALAVGAAAPGRSHNHRLLKLAHASESDVEDAEGMGRSTSSAMQRDTGDQVAKVLRLVHRDPATIPQEHLAPGELPEGPACKKPRQVAGLRPR